MLITSTPIASRSARTANTIAAASQSAQTSGDSVTLSGANSGPDPLPFAIAGSAVLAGGLSYFAAPYASGVAATVLNVAGGGLAGVAGGAALGAGIGYVAGKYGRGGWAKLRGIVNGGMIGGAVGGLAGLAAGATVASQFGSVLPALGGAVLGAGAAFAAVTMAK